MNALAFPLPLERAAPKLNAALKDYGDQACGVIRCGTVFLVFWHGNLDPLEHPSLLEACDWLRTLAKGAEIAAKRERMPS